jgi:pimeloyl-ACP methyl ester carboxylesterase
VGEAAADRTPRTPPDTRPDTPLDTRPDPPIGALDALGVLARQEVRVHDGLRHLEAFTVQGLFTVLWHEAAPVRDAAPLAAIVTGGGAMGGLLGPARGLYQRLGDTWSARGVHVLRVGYRHPNDLDACTVDLAAGVELAVRAGARRVVTMGHSFGGAVAVRAAVALGPVVAGVVTFATQSAGCELAGGLAGRPLLLFHGDRDEILPMQTSEIVRAIAGSGELVALPNDGHLLDASGDVLDERLADWLPDVLGA